MDFNLERKFKGDFEVSFVKRRRASPPRHDVEGEPASIERTYSAIDCLPTPAAWSDKHEKELKFQQGRLHSRKVQAMREGLLLPAESAVGGLSAAASASAEQIVKEHRKREAKMARDESRASGAVVPAKSSFRGLFVGQGVARLPSRPGTLESSAASSQQTSLSLPTLLRASWVRWSCACSFEWLSVGRPEMDTRRSLQAAVQTQRRVWVAKGSERSMPISSV